MPYPSNPQPPPVWSHPPYAGGAPPIPNGISVDPRYWQAGQWSYNPAFNQSGQAQPTNWLPGRAWAPSQQYGPPQSQSHSEQQQYNPYKRPVKEPSAEYMAMKLSDNPLGLTDMIPAEQLQQTPWIWNPRGLVEVDEDDSDKELFITADYRDQQGRPMAQEYRIHEPTRRENGHRGSHSSFVSHSSSSQVQSSSRSSRHATEPPPQSSYRGVSSQPLARHATEPSLDHQRLYQPSTSHPLGAGQSGDSTLRRSNTLDYSSSRPSGSRYTSPEPEDRTGNHLLVPTFSPKIVRTPEYYTKRDDGATPRPRDHVAPQRSSAAASGDLPAQMSSMNIQGPPEPLYTSNCADEPSSISPIHLENDLDPRHPRHDLSRVPESASPSPSPNHYQTRSRSRPRESSSQTHHSSSRQAAGDYSHHHHRTASSVPAPYPLPQPVSYVPAQLTGTERESAEGSYQRQTYPFTTSRHNPPPGDGHRSAPSRSSPLPETQMASSSSQQFQQQRQQTQHQQVTPPYSSKSAASSRAVTPRSSPHASQPVSQSSSAERITPTKVSPIHTQELPTPYSSASARSGSLQPSPTRPSPTRPSPTRPSRHSPRDTTPPQQPPPQPQYSSASVRTNQYSSSRTSQPQSGAYQPPAPPQSGAYQSSSQPQSGAYQSSTQQTSSSSRAAYPQQTQAQQPISSASTRAPASSQDQYSSSKHARSLSKATAKSAASGAVPQSSSQQIYSPPAPASSSYQYSSASAQRPAQHSSASSQPNPPAQPSVPPLPVPQVPIYPSSSSQQQSRYTSSSSAAINELLIPRPAPAPPSFRYKRRKGFWNRRGDVVLMNGKIVYAPENWAYPEELKDYPGEQEGYRNERGEFVAYNPNREELLESLPRHGKPPAYPYDKFVVYEYFQ